MRLFPGGRLFAPIIACLIVGPAVRADGLCDRIDTLIAAGHRDYAANAAPIAGDDEFLRRVTLDLIGRIPTATEIRSFLADHSPLKRVRAIDGLLANPECARRLGQYVDVMLMEAATTARLHGPRGRSSCVVRSQPISRTMCSSARSCPQMGPTRQPVVPPSSFSTATSIRRS